MYLMQKKALVKEKMSRLERKQTCRNAYDNYLKNTSFEEVDITQTETFKSLFRQAWRTRDKTLN
jgi:hypothetical protein